MSSTSTPNPFEVAAVPFAIFVVKSLQSLVNGLNADPVIAATQIPGAVEVLVGQVKMQFPSLAASEFGAVKSAVNADLDALAAKLAAIVPASPAAEQPAA